MHISFETFHQQQKHRQDCTKITNRKLMSYTVDVANFTFQHLVQSLAKEHYLHLLFFFHLYLFALPFLPRACYWFVRQVHAPVACLALNYFFYLYLTVALIATSY